MKIAITGHRPPKVGGYAPSVTQAYIMLELLQTFAILKDKYPSLVILTGMAQGVDQWAAEVCCDLELPFIAYLPCQGQELSWPAASQVYYHRLLEEAQSVKIISHGPYRSWKMQVRNEHLVNDSEFLIAVWNGSSGGTGNCVEYAERLNRKVLRIDPRHATKDSELPISD